MTFRDAELLWLLLVVPLSAALVFWAYRSRVAATARFGRPALVRSLVRGRSGPLRAARGLILCLGLALLVIALSGPQYGSRTRLLRKRGIDVVVALDFSKSMLAQDVRPTRLDRAKAELGRMVREMDGHRVGVVAFAGETMKFPMTTDYAAIELFLRDLGPYDMPVGGTAIGRALTEAGRLLESSRPERPEGDSAETDRGPSRVVVLITDGEDHEGDPVAAAEELAEMGVKVFVIGVGSRTGEPIPTYSPDGTWTGYLTQDGEVVTTALTEANEATLRQVAESTGGRYVRARQGTVGIDTIREEMRAMRQAEQEARRVTVHENRYALALLPAFLLLVLEGLLPEAWLGRRRRSGGEP